MTSLNDNLDPESGKVIRIVSLGEDGQCQFLPLADGQQMQILNQEDLGVTTDHLVSTEASLGLQDVSLYSL